MKSSYLTNLVLLIIVISLLWLSQREKPASEQSPTLSTLKAEAVYQIQIQRQNKPIITLQQGQDSWALTEPFHARANQTRINLLLSLLSAPLHGEFQPLDEASLQPFGLGEPDVVLSMNDQQFAFGGVESLSQQRYVLHQGMIYLVQDDVTPLLTASAGSFVDNRLIAENNAISRLTIPAGPDTADSMTLEQENGHWQSGDASLSSDELKTLVDNWQHAYAMQVRYLQAEQLSALPAPNVSVWLDAHPEPLQLILHQSEQTLHLVNPEQQLQYDFPLSLQTQLLPRTQAD